MKNWRLGNRKSATNEPYTTARHSKLKRKHAIKQLFIALFKKKTTYILCAALDVIVIVAKK